MAYTDIDDPTAYFQTTLYTGNGTAIGSGGNAITNSGNSSLQPDMVWIKNRVDTDSHSITDSVRGVTKYVLPDSNSQADSDANALAVFGSNGFTVGSNNTFNGDTHTFASWNWKAGTAFSNSAGANGASIASTGSVSTDAGFSIISYTGNGNDDDTAKIAHGLGVAVNMIMVKSINADGGWQTSSTSLGFNNVVQLNETNAQASGTYAFGQSGVAPTSTVFTVSATSGGNHTNTNNNTYIAYCFAEKQGYSKFGGYTGNGDVDGTFVYTGFKPAFVMVKRTDGGSNYWEIRDNKREPNNPMYFRLFPNINGAESQDANEKIDYVSNGFKLRNTTTGSNGSGNTYIYMAFAENPFTTSTGVPATAR